MCEDIPAAEGRWVDPAESGGKFRIFNAEFGIKLVIVLHTTERSEFMAERK
jgi:hypothetical protein